LYCTVNNSLDLNSHHSPIILILNTNASPQSHNNRPSLFSPMTDCYKFHNLLNQNINLKVKLKTEHGIDEAVNKITTLIHSAASLSNTINNSNPSSYKILHIYIYICFIYKHCILPDQVRSLIVEKQRARALYKYTRLPFHKITYYNRLANWLSD